MANLAQENEKAISGAIKIDEKEIRTHLDGLVRQSVEDTLNALLNAEADAICQALEVSAQSGSAGCTSRKLQAQVFDEGRRSGTSGSAFTNVAV